MQNFRALRVWDAAQQVASEISELLPQHKCRRLPGFHSQINRASQSIASNIAEGCSKQSRVEFRRYLETALGSAMEVQSNLVLAHTCRLLRARDHQALSGKLTVLRRMLSSLMLRVDVAAAQVPARRDGKRDQHRAPRVPHSRECHG